jgi:hypothetical protein
MAERDLTALTDLVQWQLGGWAIRWEPISQTGDHPLPLLVPSIKDDKSKIGATDGSCCSTSTARCGSRAPIVARMDLCVIADGWRADG